MNTIINKAGHQFIGISEPIQAIPQLIQAKPSLIFIDLAMPIINGYELCNQIKKVSQLKETPVVMLTGKDCMSERVKAKVNGIVDFIGKPIVEDKIMNAIEKYAK
jgi:two-component system, chemotaxis family, response regulator PixG